MPNNPENIFHLGLCMAGSISAGAYTAGVMDYFIEALENWERARDEPSVPQHRVVIDLLGGASGGGITSAMALFALHDAIEHVRLEKDGKTYKKPTNNILWNSWVELSGDDMFNQLLSVEDMRNGYVPSLLNSLFIDKVAEKFERYISDPNAGFKRDSPAYVNPSIETFLTLFNVTGINYELYSKASSGSNANTQFVSDHRDLAHFRWATNYRDDGRIPISHDNLDYLDVMIDSSKATGAFPIGLKARTVSREARFIWENPFFNRGLFHPETMYLGKRNMQPRDLYTSLNGDGGVANNEPVELARTLMRTQRDQHYGDLPLAIPLEKMSNEDKEDALKQLYNTSIILIDPFPSTDNRIDLPGKNSDNLLSYSPELIMAMRSQLLFDAKEALQGYDKENYGLHIIAPSRDGVKPPFAIASASLGGFGGFLNKQFRIHDYFLGRHNCQSFLRKYFVIDPEENDPHNLACVRAVYNGYKANPLALDRFAFRDEKGKQWVPIIPDVTLNQPIEGKQENGKIVYRESDPLPRYKLEKLPSSFVHQYESAITKRYSTVITSFFATGWFVRLLLGIGAWLFRKRVVGFVSTKIEEDFIERDLMEKKTQQW